MPAVRLVHLCLPHLEASEGGRIVAITSLAAKEPTDHLALSNAVRPGLTGWMKTLARELGPQGITVNCVAPGRIATARLDELYPDGPSRGELEGDPAAPLGRPAGVRRRRLLPRLRPRAIRHRPDGRRRRRPAARPVLAWRGSAHRPASSGVAAGLVVLAAVDPAHRCRRTTSSCSPTRPIPSRRSCGCRAATTRRGRGGIYFVDVFERRANRLESLFPFIHSGATLVPAKLIVPPGVSDSAQRSADLREMTMSQQIAAAVALRTLGYKVVATPAGVIVDAVALGSHAVGKLQPTDVIDRVNGAKTPTIAQLRTVLGARAIPGDRHARRSRAAPTDKIVKIKTVPDPLERSRALVGFTPAQSADIKLPIKVQIDAGNVGGPSAGLAFALEVMEELGHASTAATGSPRPVRSSSTGRSSPIGGVEAEDVRRPRGESRRLPRPRWG